MAATFMMKFVMIMTKGDAHHKNDQFGFFEYDEPVDGQPLCGLRFPKDKTRCSWPTKERTMFQGISSSL